MHDLFLRFAGCHCCHPRAQPGFDIFMRFSERLKPMARRSSSASPPVNSQPPWPCAEAAPETAARPAFAPAPAPARDADIRPLASLPPVQIRMHHLADNRARADDSHLHHEVVKRLRASGAEGKTSGRGSPPGTGRWCRPSATSHKLADRRPEMRHVDFFATMIADHAQRIFSAAIMPRPSRSTLMMPRSAQSSLSHWTTTRPGIVAGSSGTT